MGEIVFGAMSPPLSEQLAHLGLPPDVLTHADRDAEAIARLRVRGLISATERDRACRRLLKNLEREAGRQVLSTHGEKDNG